MTHRTRIKICGLTRAEDLQAAVAAGADAIGFVFYPQSPRYIAPEPAGRLIRNVPPFITAVGLFVNASPESVAEVLSHAPVSLLQFHGDETVAECNRIAELVKRPYIRAVRVKPEMGAVDLIKCEQEFQSSGNWFAGLLLDAFVDGYGGGGKVFDWSVIPKELAPRLVLSGGLNERNAAEAVRALRPYAVDVSSGVELAKGIKDTAKIRTFIDIVRKADGESNT